MLNSLVFTGGGVAALAVLWVLTAWLLDLAWMIWMRRWVFVLVLLTLALAWGLSGLVVGGPNLRLMLAFGLTTLIVRPLVDFLTWLYDLSPIGFIDALPFVEWETWKDYRARLQDPPLLEWDYFRERCRFGQEFDFRESLGAGDGDLDQQEEGETRP